MTCKLQVASQIRKLLHKVPPVIKNLQAAESKTKNSSIISPRRLRHYMAQNEHPQDEEHSIPRQVLVTGTNLLLGN